MIRWRQKAGLGLSLGLGLVFAGLLVALAIAERWLPLGVPVDENGLTRRLVGLGLAFGPLAMLVVVVLRGSPRGRLLRVQASVFAILLGFAVLAKALHLYVVPSALVVPVGAVALLVATLVDRGAGVAAALTLALVASALGPFDPRAALVLGAQGAGAALALGGRKRREAFLVAGLCGGAVASVASLAVLLLFSRLPLDDALVYLGLAGLGGLVSGPLAGLLRSPAERLIGDIPKAKLIELADLSSPLLKQIASEAPGTWQHSLAMANMAEIAATAMGANALLVRVGAYYHDLGKSLQPQYYIENLAAGQPSPHDSLPPEVSADAIFAHVTEGVRLARARKLPEAVVDFMHMHHGDGVLEYFWDKCQEQGNPRKLAESAFRYPGMRPQTRETAILAICDAVEAASRTLRQPEARSIEALVQRIVYGKLHLGQLDEAGLSVADLQVLANTLVSTIKHAHHVRIEYPWQKEAAREASMPSMPALAETVLLKRREEK